MQEMAGNTVHNPLMSADLLEEEESLPSILALRIK